MNEEPNTELVKGLNKEEIKDNAASSAFSKEENNENAQKSKKNSKSNSSEHTNKKSNLKQMTLTEIAKNSYPKLNVILNAPSSNGATEPAELIHPNKEVDVSQIEKKDEANKENESTNNENNEKISFSKRNIVKILGCNYNSNNQLIFAVQLKKPAKTLYVPYLDLKKRSPQILCDYFESLISFI